MCTRPMIGIPVGLTEKGKVKYNIVSYSSMFGSYEQKGSYDARPTKWDSVLIPCGHCPECRKRYAKQWSDRCMIELRNHDSSYFVTLTYDDDTLFKVNGIPSLNKKHLSQFMKDLRQRIHLDNRKYGYPEYPIKFYACGEYGSHTKRPHYHLIIFGLKLRDVQPCPESPNISISPWLSNIWKKGFVSVGDVTPASCSYVAGYVNKKAENDERDKYLALGLQPEFTQMSLRPAIGKEKVDCDPEMVTEIFEKGYLPLSTEKGGIKVYPPRYYEKFYEKSHPLEYEKLKESRKVRMSHRARMLNESTSLSFEDRLLSEETNLKARLKSEVRDSI